MGNKDADKSSKSDKSESSVPMDQNKIHIYPNWAAMQAYYCPRVNMPPYYNSAVASSHAPPPYIWGLAHPMMPPYGSPYATIYPHGGVYAHPAVPLVSHGHGVPSPTAAAAPVETPTKPSGNTEQGSMKKLKGFDGHVISIGNGTAERRAEPRSSQSAESGGSIDGSDGNTTGTDQSRRKRSREGTPTIAVGAGKIEAKSNPVAAEEMTATVSPKPIRTLLSPGTLPSSMGVRCGVMPSEVRLQNEREIKRERRKQSNRESARRSRLRKQAEIEELARKVESLTSENATLRSEINQLSEKSEKLRLEKAILVEGLKNAQVGDLQEIILNKKEDKEGEMYEEKSNTGAKLRQLLDPSPRANAVAAG